MSKPLGLGSLAALVAFGVLTALAVSTPYFGIDLTVTRAIQSLPPSGIESLANAVSWIGFPPQSNVIVGAIILVLFVSGLRWEAVCTFVASAGSAGLWFLIAPLVHRARPSADLVRVATDIAYGSYPSGHVLNLTATYGFLVFVAWTRLPPGNPLRWAVLAACTVLLLSVGLARVYLGEHWPSDVLGGYLLGAVWLTLSIQLYAWRRRRAHSFSARHSSL